MKLGEMIPGEQTNVDAALQKLPKAQRAFYGAQYSVGEPWGRGAEGTFVGLACKVCNRWSDCGHDDDCPVKSLS